MADIGGCLEYGRLARRVVVIVPRGPADHGRRIGAAVAATLRECHARVVYIDNGRHARGADWIPSDVESTISLPESGLPGALQAGYQHVLSSSRAPDPVVRMDCDEHPLAVLPVLLRELAHADFVVAVPQLDQTTVTNYEDFDNHDRVIPALFAKISPHLSVLGGAHGYQAWSHGALMLTLPFATEVMEMAARSVGHPLRWGFDAAMVVSAVVQGRKVAVVGYPPSEFRHRSASKATEQARCVAAVVHSALALQAAGGGSDSTTEAGGESR